MKTDPIINCGGIVAPAKYIVPLVCTTLFTDVLLASDTNNGVGVPAKIISVVPVVPFQILKFIMNNMALSGML